MSQSFTRLTPDKQAHILDAAYEEFAEKGYDLASTNNIAKDAGIGKGTLFYYFNNKESLFIYLIDNAFELMDELYFQNVDYGERDIFDRLLAFTNVKNAHYSHHKAAFDFLGHILLNINRYSPLYPQLLEKNAHVEKNTEAILTENIDLSKFRENLDPQASIKLINWSIEGYRDELAKRYQDADFTQLNQEDLGPVFEEFYNYIHTLKIAYYNPEYIHPTEG